MDGVEDVKNEWWQQLVARWWVCTSNFKIHIVEVYLAM